MQTTHDMKYELLLASVIAARATSFLFNKLILRSMDLFSLLAVRFLLAFLLLSLLFRREWKRVDRRTLASGVMIGALFFLTMTCELTALAQADSSLVSLLENCAILFVPLFGMVLDRRLPDRVSAVSAVTAMLGVVLLALQQGTLSGGFTFGILSAVCYALAIRTTAKRTAGSERTLLIGILQVGTIGVLSLAASLLRGGLQLPSGGGSWLMMAALVVVCTGFGYTLQPVAQSRVSAERAGLFCAISPAISTLLGVLILKEKLGGLSIAGLLLILLSIALPYLMEQKRNVVAPEREESH